MASRKRTSRTVQAVLAAGLLCGLAAPPASADPDGPAADCEHGQVLVGAGIVPRQALVESVAAACGLHLIQPAELGGDTRPPAEALPLADFVERVLADESYQLHVTRDSGTRRGALWIFADAGSIPPEAQLLIETTLLQAEFAARRGAVRQLRRLANGDAVRLLSYALADPDERIRDAAAESLAAIGGDEALAALASSVANADAAGRADAVEAISLAGGDSALAYLEQGVNDPDPRVRAAAVEALGELEATASRTLVQHALDDPDAAVRRRAVEVLEELDEDALFRSLLPAD